MKPKSFNLLDVMAAVFVFEKPEMLYCLGTLKQCGYLKKLLLKSFLLLYESSLLVNLFPFKLNLIEFFPFSIVLIKSNYK